MLKLKIIKIKILNLIFYLKKIIENTSFFYIGKCCFAMMSLSYLQVCYFFLNIFVGIPLYYIYNLNQNQNQIDSEWLNEQFTLNFFFIWFCLFLFVFSIWVFLLKNSSLDVDFCEVFTWIFLLTLFFLIPTLLIFGSISENLSLKKDLLFPETYKIPAVFRKMSFSEAETVFWEMAQTFLGNMFQKNPQKFEFSSRIYFEVLKKDTNFVQCFQSAYALAPAKPKFVVAVFSNLELYWEQLENAVLPNTVWQKKNNFFNSWVEWFHFKMSNQKSYLLKSYFVDLDELGLPTRYKKQFQPFDISKYLQKDLPISDISKYLQKDLPTFDLTKVLAKEQNYLTCEPTPWDPVRYRHSKGHYYLLMDNHGKVMYTTNRELLYKYHPGIGIEVEKKFHLISEPISTNWKIFDRNRNLIWYTSDGRHSERVINATNIFSEIAPDFYKKTWTIIREENGVFFFID